MRKVWIGTYLLASPAALELQLVGRWTRMRTWSGGTCELVYVLDWGEQSGFPPEGYGAALKSARDLLSCFE